MFSILFSQPIYPQILPDASLDFCFSATAMHWLSGKPCDLSNHIHMEGAKGKEQEIFSEFGKQNWEIILLHRSQELKLGGRMELVNFGIDEESSADD